MTHTEIKLLNGLVSGLEKHPMGEPVRAHLLRDKSSVNGTNWAALLKLAASIGLVSISSDSFGRTLLTLEPDYLHVFSRVYATEQARKPGRPMGRSAQTLESWVKHLTAAGWTCIPPKSTEPA